MNCFKCAYFDICKYIEAAIVLKYKTSEKKILYKKIDCNNYKRMKEL